MTSRTEASPVRRKRLDGRSIEGGERMDDTVHGLAMVRPDLESRLTDDHHDALRLWLRLLTCTTMVERERSRRSTACTWLSLWPETKPNGHFSPAN